ncbi:MAG: IS256 family transposase, partial [Candidatus Riesia sp.]|nr:IS256 family transposase [Candidatus Riesia sp.]
MDNTNSNKGFDYNKFKKEAINKLKSGSSIAGKNGAFTPLIKEFLEAALSEEINGYLSGEESDNNTNIDDKDNYYGDVNNKRNGYSSKIVKSDVGEFELNTPRDRVGKFEPQIVKKGQTILTEDLDKKIINLYASGMSYSAIVSHIQDMYGINISTSTITNITDKIIPKIKEFKERSLDEVYAIIYLDAMHFKVKENGRIITKAFYTVLGVNLDGYKDILGIYIQDSEGANFWMSVLSDLQNRGVKDILIACIDGLKGFPESINTIFPKTEIQLCIIHQIRNSCKYIASKDQKEFVADLKKIYKANTKEFAENKLLELEENWGKKYPIILKSWNDNWEKLSAFFKYPAEIRRIIYTTNIVEGFHRQVRKITKTKGAFSSETA